MAETKINANQTNITASDIGAQDTLQYSEFPGHPSSSSYSAETTSEWEGKIIQYTGVKRSGSLWPGEDAVINTGVFLKAVSTTSGTPQASASYTSSVITGVTVNATTFVNTMKQYIPNHDFVGDNTFVYDADSWAWILQPDGVVIGEFWPDFEAEATGMRALGITISSTGGVEFQTGDTIIVTISGITKKYYWKPVNVDAVALVNTASSTTGLTVAGTPTTSNGINIGLGSSTNGGVSIGGSAQGNDGGTGVAIGQSTQVRSANCISIGYDAVSGFNNGAGTAPNGIAIGTYSRTNAPYAIQLGSIGTDTGGGAYNDVANTFKVANQNGNFEIMSADGTIPEARLASTASATQGQVLTLDTNLNAVWETPSGGSSLPDMTGQSGKFLTTDGSAASWSDKPLVNNHTGTMALSICGTNTAPTGNWTVAVGFDSSAYYSGTAIGYRARSSGIQCIAIGYTSSCGGDRSIAIGYNSQVTAQEAYQLGYGVNSERGTFYVGMSPDNGATWQNHKLLDKDGTIPEARLADTTNAQEGDALTLNSSGNAVWTSPLQYVLGGLQTTDSSKVGYLQYYFEENNAVNAPADGKWLVLDCLKVNTSNGLTYVFSADFTSPVGSIVAGGTQIAAARSGYTTRALLLKVE